MGYEFGLSRRIYGVVCGVVTDNKHPEGDYRVKVKFPWISSTDAGDKEDFISSWARVTSNMAGGGRGFYCLPEPDDEVLVSFIHGDVRLPVVIGSLWNKEDKMPVGDSASGNKGVADPLGNDVGIGAAAVDNNAAGGKNNARFFLSRAGHMLIFDDTDGKESMTLISKSGHGLHFNDEKDNIAMHDASGEEYMVLDGKNKKIIIETKNGDIDILCKNGKLNVEAKEIFVKSTTTATYESKNDTKIESKSSNIVIKASSKIDADASKIELN
ncbi:MAG: hypothetical protein CVU56_27210 [Deltaproteobacteria bacterium HGW-Deltaproteobacteria-14]|jgi:uncharacterized protein involved in type VI secretion and phage assembly|nr:MAG: hypothetical protein CVU56_27210 [Deltaproteobacteria bacterium HGW-Deltaproteobacteria-14]